MICLNDLTPEVDNTNGFTRKAIDQVNRSTTLIEGAVNRGNCPSKTDETKREQSLNHSIAFSGLLAHYFGNLDVGQFTENLAFSSLFIMAYRKRNENSPLMFIIRVTNRKDLTPDWLKTQNTKSNVILS